MSSSLTPVNGTPTAITATPSPGAIPSHYFVATIIVHFTSVNNNGYESNILDGILDIVEMGTTPTANINLSSLCETIHNALSQEQGSLQE